MNINKTAGENVKKANRIQIGRSCIFYFEFFYDVCFVETVAVSRKGGNACRGCVYFLINVSLLLKKRCEDKALAGRWW